MHSAYEVKRFMRTLFYVPLCPFSRKVRIILAERKLDYQPVIENVWKQREEFLEINPAGQAPVLVDLNHQVICDSTVICEYIDETYSEHSLIGEDVLQRAETRRLVAWFDGKFNRDVTHKLVFEKALKRHFGRGNPDSPSPSRIFFMAD
jgi:glutathione S-transferase